MKRVILSLFLATITSPAYVLLPAIAEYRQNKGEITITSFKWRSDPNYGSNGHVKYLVSAKNNTKKYVSRVRVEITTYDASGSPVASVTDYVKAIAPGKTRVLDSSMEYYGTEKKATLEVIDFSYSD